MTDVDAVRARLADAGRRLAEANAARATALEDASVAMREGRGSLDVKEMAELAGVSRVTAYRLLGEA